MDFVALVTPASESELMTTVAMLKAYGIPHQVPGSGFGSLYPSIQSVSYGARTILVPAESLEEARAVLASGAGTDDQDTTS